MRDYSDSVLFDKITAPGDGDVLRFRKGYLRLTEIRAVQDRKSLNAPYPNVRDSAYSPHAAKASLKARSPGAPFSIAMMARRWLT